MILCQNTFTNNQKVKFQYSEEFIDLKFNKINAMSLKFLVKGAGYFSK